MAGGGVGEAMLIGAAVGAGTGGVMSAVQDKDPLEGALLGAAMGAAGGGIGSGIGGLASGATAGTGAGAATGTAGGAIGGEVGGAVGGTTGAAGGAGGAQVSTLAGAYGSGAPLGSSVVPSAFTPAGSGLVGGTGAGVPTVASGAAGMTGGATGGVGGGATGGAAGAPTSWGAQGLGQGFAPTLTNAQAYGAGAGGGIMGLIGNAQNQGEQWAPEQDPYSGSLSYFKYNPQTFQPSVAPGYADGGIASIGPQGAMYPQSQIPDRTQFAVPSQMPTSREVVAADYDTRINPYTGDMMMASGGISSLGHYSDGGRMLKGPGDGMSDDIPGVIAGKQPARLADGEFVVPADVVSHLGNGSTDAGAKKLYSMMDNVRKARTGSKKQGKQIKAEKHIPGMKSGGIAYYEEGGTTSEPMPEWFSNYLSEQQSAPKPGMGAISSGFQPTGYQGNEFQYSPYTLANRPSSSQPQYYQDIYQGSYPDYSTPGYTLAGNLGQWSNVMGEQQRAAQPASQAQQVTQSYLQNLGRAPDQAGFDYWMQTGAPTSQINKSIQMSPEAYNIGTGPSAADYIANLYQQHLGRAPDADGFGYWQQQMGNNMNASQVQQAIMNSQEAQIRNAYQQYLGRTPDEGGMKYYAEQMSGGMTPQQLQAELKSSEEAKAKSAPKTENKRRGGIASLV
jgi:hypothetical protein